MNVATYYDTWGERLVGDYQIRNRRVVKALDFAQAALADARTVLDVGCGIGWTSAEIAATGRQVTGIDISPALIETATEMFGDRCEFVAGDFATHDMGRYDAILMVDVYEHFPRDTRETVHAQIRRTGATKIILTVPMVWMQDWARANTVPLQPIDEHVTDEDLERLAADVDGHMTVNQPVSIWRTNDYRHVLIEAR